MLRRNWRLPSAQILYVLAMPEPAPGGPHHWPPLKEAGSQLLDNPEKVACEHIRTAASSLDAASEAQ